MDMGTQGSGRKRLPNRERLSAEDDALNQIAREAEARLAAKRAARAEAREIRMKELERQQKEIYQVQKKYYGLDTKWGDIEQWMEDSERYSRRPRRNTSASDEDERMSVGSRGSLRSQPDAEFGGTFTWTNGYDGDVYGSQPLNRRSGRNSSFSGDCRVSTVPSSREEKLGLSCSDLGPSSSGLASKPLSTQNGNRPSYLCSAARPSGSYRVSLFDESSLSGARRGSASGSRAASEYSGYFNSSSRASSRASSARASPVVEERPEKDFAEKGSRNMPSLSAATLASLGGTSSRRGSGDTSVSIDTEASMREIKELNELKDQIQDVEGKYFQGLKDMKDSLAEVEEKYKKAMVSNAQLDNEKTNFMYQVDALKDTLLELEEELAESRRQYEEKNKEFEREKHAHSILQFQFAEVKEALKQREEMLEEIRQLQQKQANCIREISDLQETVEWKDKKIGALERQKEFFDSIRSERDDLRDEVVVLKDKLKKHGILLNSDTVANGETSSTFNNVSHQRPNNMTKDELGALKLTGDQPLGRAREVEVRNDSVAKVGKGGSLPDSEQEPHQEERVKDCSDREGVHAGENSEGQETSQGKAPPPGPLADATSEEQVTSEAGGGTGMSPEEPQGLSDLGSEGPEPVAEPHQGSTRDMENEREESAEKQEVITTPCQESVSLQTPGEGGSDTAPREQGGSPTESVEEAGGTNVGEQMSTVTSSLPKCSEDPMNQDENHPVDVSADPHTESKLDKELSNQKVVELKEAPTQSVDVGTENQAKEDETELIDEKPTQPEEQASPCSPAAKSSHHKARGSGKVDPGSEPLDLKEPDEEKNSQQGEALDSSQKKTKNKKKKNKKKKSPVPVESPQEDMEGLTFQKTDLSEVKEEDQVQLSDENSAGEAQHKVTKDAKPKIVPGSSEDVECAESPGMELDGICNQEEDIVESAEGNGIAGGDTLNVEGPAVQSPGTSAGENEPEGSVMKDAAGEQRAGQSSPADLEDEDEDRRPYGEMSNVYQTDSTERCVVSGHPSQTVEKALENSVGNCTSPAPTGELEDLQSEHEGDPRCENEKGRSKEDCTMS